MSFNLFFGNVNDWTGGYTTGMWIFSLLGFAGILFAFLLRKNDARYGNSILEKSNYRSEA